MAREDENDEEVPRSAWIPSAIGVAKETDRRRDRSLPAPDLPENDVGPESERRGGGPSEEAPVASEEWGAATGLARERARPPPGESEPEGEP